MSQLPTSAFTQKSATSFRGKQCRVLRPIHGDIHGVPYEIPAGATVRVVAQRGQVYAVDYLGDHFNVMDDNLVHLV